MKKIAIVSLLLMGTAIFAGPKKERMSIPWRCSQLAACPLLLGPFAKGTAFKGRRMFLARGSSRTCCQLSASIHADMCHAGYEAKNTVVTCE